MSDSLSKEVGVTYDRFVRGMEWWTRAFKEYRGMSPLEAAEHNLGLRSDLVADLKALPFADHIRVFGSSAQVPDGSRIPGDLDIFVDLNPVTSNRYVAADQILNLMRTYFGLLDAYILNHSGRLYCHSEATHPEQMQWVMVNRHAKAIIEAGHGGIPMQKFSPRYEIPEDVRAEFGDRFAEHEGMAISR
jgi:hypothetical protein